MNNADLFESLVDKIKILNETTWERRAGRPQINEWLENFDEEERIQVLFLLSRFMYFGSIQMRTLLQALYRDLYKYKVVEKIRIDNENTRNLNLINRKLRIAENKTRFLGIGNPSESGPHLLYFFRQENRIANNLFINSHEIFNREGSDVKLNFPDVNHYVFIDDFCGSGSQASGYSKTVLKELKSLNKDVETSYLMLFGTQKGKTVVERETLFDNVESVYELDDTFQCFKEESRIFKHSPSLIDQKKCDIVSSKYGKQLMKSILKRGGWPDDQIDFNSNFHRHGFGDGQLLIGFHHNTPDNCLPIFWYDEKDVTWTPIFKRYNKKYGN